MSCTRELAAFSFDLVLTSTQWAYFWDPQWHPVTGVATVDFALDVNLEQVPVGGGTTWEVIPALQHAAVRTDRPGTGAAVSGTPVSGVATPTHYAGTTTESSNFWFRRGIAARLQGTTPTLANLKGVLNTAFRMEGLSLPVQELVFNPLNSTTIPNVYPLGTFPTAGVDKAKLAVILRDNLNNKMEWQLYARVFDDKEARGSWTAKGSLQTTTAGYSAVNTGEITLSGGGFTPADHQWIEFAFGVSKNGTLDANSRCIFEILTALRYA